MESDSIILKTSLFKTLFVFLFFLFSFTAVIEHTILDHTSAFIIFTAFICFFGTVYFLVVLINHKKSKIIFNKDGLIVYNIFSGKPSYYVPLRYLYGIHFKDKLPSAMNIVLVPYQFSDKEYMKVLKTVKMPEYLLKCQQQIPRVLLTQLHIPLYFYKVNLKTIKPLLQEYINSKNI